MIINLTQDQFTIVDDIDYEYLLQFKWYAKKERTGKFYAVRNERVNGKRKHKNIYIHRVIAERMGLDLSCDIDHIDRDSLNNLRNNLRFATKTATSQNRSKHKNNTSGIPGVYWHKVAGKWQAQIKVNNKTKYLGLFGNINEAAEVYKEASLKYFKEFSPLNGE